MEIPRQLIYKERTDINDFDINKEGVPNKNLYDKWFLLRPDLFPEKRGIALRKLRAFNDAHFMCTLLLLYKDSCENALPFLVSRTNLPSIVIPMVHFYLSNLSNKTNDIERLLKSIEAAAQNDEKWKKNLDDITKLKKINIEESTFKLCGISEKMLSRIPYSVWEKATDHFSESTIKIIIRKVSKNSKDQLLIAEAIHQAAIKEIEAENREYTINEEPSPNDIDNWEDVDLGEIPDSDSITYGIVNEIKENNGLKDSLLTTEEVPLNEELQDRKERATEELKSTLQNLCSSQFNSNPNRFTESWFCNMIDQLMNTRWGTYVAEKWKKDDTHDTITCSLVGVLCDLHIFKKKSSGRISYADLAREMNTNCNQQKRFSDYLSHKVHAKINQFELSKWLNEYLECSLCDVFTTESNDKKMNRKKTQQH